MAIQQSQNSLQMQDSDMTRCIDNCMNTARTCLEAIHYCLNEKGFAGKHIELMQTCVETCHLSTRLMIADSEFHHQACELCFEVCDACAAECENFVEDEMLTRVARACRKSAESCRGMAGMTVRVSSRSSSRDNAARM